MIISSNIIPLEMSSDAAGCGDRPALGLKSVRAMIDIKSIPTPCVVLSDNLYGWFARQIRKHEPGQYSHAMWFTSQRQFVSQDWRIHLVDPAEYFRGEHRLKFLCNPDLENHRYAEEIEAVLARQVERGSRYDWLGIVGHLVGAPRINFKGRYYCSEAVWQPFVEVLGYREWYPTPEDLNYWLPRMGWRTVLTFDPNQVPWPEIQF